MVIHREILKFDLGIPLQLLSNLSGTLILGFRISTKQVVDAVGVNFGAYVGTLGELHSLVNVVERQP